MVNIGLRSKPLSITQLRAVTRDRSNSEVLLASFSKLINILRNGQMNKIRFVFDEIPL